MRSLPKHTYTNKGKAIVVIIALFVGLMHFVIGPNYRGPYKDFMIGYLIDIILPVSLYLLFHLSLQQKLPLNISRFTSASVVMAIGIMVETLQYFGVQIFGNTFDPFDFLMYALGVFIGWVIDITVLKHFMIQK